MADSEQHEHNLRMRIKGIFSSERIAKVGAGSTARKTTQTMYWYAEEGEDGLIWVQPLNPNYIPSGPKQEILKEQFLEHYAPEPEFYTTKVYPSMRRLNQTIAKAERYRGNGDCYSAEYEFGNALRVDEENIRANFGLGLTYLDRGETDKADNIFQRLVRMEGAFEAEHKHLFNDFGISLRKNGMYDQALEYYAKALELSPADENLHYNMARACFSKADIGKAAEHLYSALKLNKDFEVAQKFLLFLKKNNMLPTSPAGTGVPSSSS
ncbi:MAG: tetratricopeptide repeat protein [Desulfovibrionales bacterium]|nr:tetratricopeptide repeat protein [Desulfovibrionales bacterium]